MRNDARLVVLLAVALCVPAVSRAQSSAATSNSSVPSSTTAAAPSPTSVTGPRKYVTGVDFANGHFSSSTYDSSSDSSTSTYSSTSRSLSAGISPNLGIFLNDKLVVGADVSFSFGRNSGDSASDGVVDSKSKSHSAYFSVGPFLRKYFGNPQGRGMPFIQIGGGIGTEIYGGTYTPVTGPYGYDYNEKGYHSQYVQALVGYEMFLTELLGLQYYGGWDYSSFSYDYTYDYISDPDTTNHYKGHSQQGVFGIGLKVYLHGKK